MTQINSIHAQATYNAKLEVPTLSGERVNLLNPDPSTIKIVDISAGLSNCCRFVGQLAHFGARPRACSEKLGWFPPVPSD